MEYSNIRRRSLTARGDEEDKEQGSRSYQEEEERVKFIGVRIEKRGTNKNHL